MTRDSLNKNTNIKYDYRNLITQIQHKAIVNTDTSFYLTYYSYDEAGNRFAKTIYKYTSSSGPPEDSNPGGPVTDDYWDLYSVEIYSRDISGKELAIYKDNVILEYPLYGLDMIGKIKNDELFFYYKDHLGSVRATVNSSGDLVSAQDYDAWGYLLQDRTFDSEDTKFKFTSKERDSESDYDYFGARYYDARIGRWGQVDPQLSNSPSFTPYNYTSDNPIARIDPSGLDDFYYTIGKQYKRVHTDIDENRYFVRHEKGNIYFEGNNYFRANSEQTVKLYPEWKNVDVNFTNYKLITAFLSAIPPEGEEILSSLTYTLTESVGGRMDQKEFVLNDDQTLFIFDYIAFNKNEAGNIIWGAVMNYLGFSEEFTTDIANKTTILRKQRSDELEEQIAIKRGWYYYDSDFKQFYKPKIQ